MKAKFILVAVTSLFALSLTACDRNKHPASDNAADTSASTTNALDYNRSNSTAPDAVTTRSDASSPGHGPVPADNNAVTNDTVANGTDMATSNTDNTTANTDATTTHTDMDTSANNAQDNSNASTGSNPNDIANPTPS